MKTKRLFLLVAITLLGCSGPDSPVGRIGRVAPTADGKGAAASAPLEFASRRVVESGSFADLPDRGELMAYLGSGAAKRDGAYTWHQVAVSEEHALRAIGNGSLRVQAPSGDVLVIQYDHVVEHPSGDWTWVGHLREDPGAQTIITFGAEAVFGSIAQAARRSLRLTSRNGVAWLVETDPAKLAGLASAGANPRNPDHLAVPKQLVTGRADTSSTQPQTVSAVSDAATAATTVDVAVGYTGGMVSRLGSASAVLTRINYLVTTTNEAYANSQIDARVRLVRAERVSYTDSNTNQDALEQLTGYDLDNQEYTAPNAAFDDLRAAREQYGADLVVLLRPFLDPEQDGCGIAWLIGGGKSGVSTGDGQDYFGYSIVGDGEDRNEEDGELYFCRDESFAHELGHNMGSNHDRENAKGDDGVLDDPDDYGAFSYSFGYKTGAGSGNFYTIMAYGDNGQQDYRVFSNPRITTCGGRACGTTNDDNARSLEQIIPVVAQFRATSVIDTPADDIAPGMVSSDINGDGRDDLFYRNDTRFLYWLMDGTTRLDWRSYTVRSDTRLAGYGDFDGNGRADLIWIRPSREVFLWLGTGTGFSTKFSHVHGEGWFMVGVADMNHDGRDDLLWYNPVKNSLVVWYMDGFSKTAYQIHAVPAGYRYVGSGDFNGDGLGDIIWDTAARDLYVWMNNGASFASTFVRTYQSGWKVAGTRDIDRDGRSDMQWHNQIQGKLVYWRMNGPAIASYKTFSIDSAFQSTGTGDFNGDGYGDMLWRNDSRELYMWLGTGTTFTSQFVAQNGEGWSVVN